MTTGYIELPVITDSDVIMQQAIANIAEAVTGWVPREGNLEVLILEQMALAVAEAATTASSVPDDIFTYFGSLVGITPLPGTSETIWVSITLTSPAATSPGYQIPSGTQFGFYFSGAQYVFQTMADAVITTGNQSINLTLQAVTPGAAYNLDQLALTSSLNLSNLYLQRLNPDPLIASVELINTPGNTLYATGYTPVVGTDPETTTAFLNRLASELQLLAPRPITSSDYALFAQNVAGIFRALAFDGINPFTNLLSAANANLTMATTSASAPAGWSGIGDGTHVAALSTPGTAPSNQLTVTTASTSLTTGAPLVNAVNAFSGTSITVTVGTGTAISTSVSATNPAIGLLIDSTQGNEAVVIIGAAATTGSGASTQQVLTLASETQFYHNAGIVLNVYQGAALPLVGAAPGSNGVTPTNSLYYQAAAVVECGSDTTATAQPMVVALAEYIDGTTATFTSYPYFTSGLYDYTTGPKTLICPVPVYSPLSTNKLAVYANAPYSTLAPTLVSVQTYIVWGGAGTSKTHYVYYANVGASELDLGSTDALDVGSSNFNFIPDPDFESYYFANSALSSWTLSSGLVALPGYGIQYQGNYQTFAVGGVSGTTITINSTAGLASGMSVVNTAAGVNTTISSITNATQFVVASATGITTSTPLTIGGGLGNLTATSQIFNLSDFGFIDPSSTSRTYMLFANVDTTYTGSTYANVTVEIYNVITGAILNAPSAITLSPGSAGINTLSTSFTLTSPVDVQVKIIFGSGLQVPINSSVIVSNLGIMSDLNGYAQTVPAATLIPNNDYGYSWTPGGLYSTQTFNSPRMISICPVDVNGLAITDAIKFNLSTYLSSRREVNFITNILNPSYVPIDVQWTAYVAPGYTPATVQSNVNAAIRAFLNPATWGGGANNPPYWNGAALVVRVWDIAAIIAETEGVASITSVTTRTSYPTSGAYGTADITMIGAAPLPIANNIIGTMIESPGNAYQGLS